MKPDMTGSATSKGATEKSAQIKITISKDAMTATVIIRSHSTEDLTITSQDILDEVEASGIVHGLDEATVNRVVEQKLVNQAIIIASGTPPMRGNPTKFEYNFDTSSEHRPEEDERGHVDYKNIKFIQSVSKGDVLVTKIPATAGISGKSIMGKELRAPSGADLPFRKGNNTQVAEDGLHLLAAADGVIFYANGVVAVKDVTVIQGDVDFGVGNIDSKASVQVFGNVRTGFSVKTSGDIEVNGMVEDCNLYAEGNIFVTGGIFGQGEGEVTAKGDITAKFVENHKLKAGNDINLGEAAVNSKIEAGNAVMVTGKAGRIVGGQCSAGSKIEVAIAGSPAGTTTVLQIELARDLISGLEEINRSMARVEEDSKRVAKAVDDLSQLKAEGKLSVEKSCQLDELVKIRDSFPEQIEQLQSKKAEIELQLGEKVSPSIRIQKLLHAGVIARFGKAQKTVIDQSGPGRFELTDNQIEFKSK